MVPYFRQNHSSLFLFIADHRLVVKQWSNQRQNLAVEAGDPAVTVLGRSSWRTLVGKSLGVVTLGSWIRTQFPTVLTSLYQSGSSRRQPHSMVRTVRQARLSKMAVADIGSEISWAEAEDGDKIPLSDLEAGEKEFGSESKGHLL